ncbi:MAG: hypothetical protein H7230_03360 [Candidatus Parcubacteria bacterium]|nr:hypothetical protein [Candidatus Paceibacterota bacterium]
MTQPTLSPTHFVLLGASGNLAKIKIIPALATQNELEITLWSRKLLSYTVPATYQIIQSDYTSIETWNNLLSGISNKRLIVYLSLPPVSYQDILTTISQIQNIENISLDIIIEKPFAADSTNMKQTLELIQSSPILERSVHFFDHFLFKDIETFELGNQPLRTVTIRCLETNDAVGRIAFYDKTGATRDMISHLMFFGELFCVHSKLVMGFDWGNYNIKNYTTVQYAGYNDNPELQGIVSNTETYFDLELHNPALMPSTIRLISGKKQPARVWDIEINGTKINLIGQSQFEHLKMIKALENEDYSSFVTAKQVEDMWRLIDSLPKK